MGSLKALPDRELGQESEELSVVEKVTGSLKEEPLVDHPRDSWTLRDREITGSLKVHRAWELEAPQAASPWSKDHGFIEGTRALRRWN